MDKEVDRVRSSGTTHDTESSWPIKRPLAPYHTRNKLGRQSWNMLWASGRCWDLESTECACELRQLECLSVNSDRGRKSSILFLFTIVVGAHCIRIWRRDALPYGAWRFKIVGRPTGTSQAMVKLRSLGREFAMKCIKYHEEWRLWQSNDRVYLCWVLYSDVQQYHVEYKVEFQKYGTDGSSFPGGTKAIITRLGPPPQSACSSTDGPNTHWTVNHANLSFVMRCKGKASAFERQCCMCAASAHCQSPLLVGRGFPCRRPPPPFPAPAPHPALYLCTWRLEHRCLNNQGCRSDELTPLQIAVALEYGASLHLAIRSGGTNLMPGIAPQGVCRMLWATPQQTVSEGIF